MATNTAAATTGAATPTATGGTVGPTTPGGAHGGATGGPPTTNPGGGQPPPPPPPPPQGGNGNPLPRRDLDPPLENVMDAFKSDQRNDPQVAVKMHDKLNTELIGTRDSTHHGYVMLAKTDKRLVVVHRLSYYQAPFGTTNKAWHQKLFAFTGDVMGTQMPQTIQWSARSLEILPRAIRVSKLNAQIATLMNIDVETLTPVVAGAEAATYDEVLTRHAMYVPGKYLPLLLARPMTPKETLLAINAEAVTQGEQDALDRELTGLESQSLGLLQTTPPHPWWRARFRQPSRLWTASLLKNNVLWLRGTYQLGVLPTQQRVAVLPR